MLGREVMLPATLIVRPSEEPVDTTVPFVVTFGQLMPRLDKQSSEPLRLKSLIMITDPGPCSLL